MGLRFRKSLKIAPGVKLNLGSKSIGMSLGTKGARISANSNGRVTRTLGIPGTGISHVTTMNSWGKNRKNSPPPSTANSFQDNGMDQDSSGGSGGQPPRNKKPFNTRLFSYFFFCVVLTIINNSFLYPAIVLMCIIHLRYIKKELTYHPKQKKYRNITRGILVFSIFGVLLSVPSPPKIETISLSATNNIMDIQEKTTIQVTYTPTDASDSNIDIQISSEDFTEVPILKNGVLELETLSKEGQFTIVAESGTIKSNEITIAVVDKEKQEAERLAAEKKAEEERLAAEKIAEEERLAAEKIAEEERLAAEKNTSQKEQADDGPTVYVTPTGKRYHYDDSCNDGNYSASTLDKATARGLTPCNKCA